MSYQTKRTATKNDFQEILDDYYKTGVEKLVQQINEAMIKQGNVTIYNQQKEKHCERSVEISEIDAVKNKVNTKWVYRLESKSPDNGLWYNTDNKLVWGIGKLPECKTKDLPMDYDSRYHADGRNWFSSCSNKEDLMHWYSVDDAINLINNGFVFTRYLATEYTEYENETVFIKDTCLAREEIDIRDLFPGELCE